MRCCLYCLFILIGLSSVNVFAEPVSPPSQQTSSQDGEDKEGAVTPKKDSMEGPTTQDGDEEVREKVDPDDPSEVDQTIDSEDHQQGDHGDEDDSESASEETPSDDRTLLETELAPRGLMRLHRRGSGLTPDDGAWSVGIFNPLSVQFAADWGLETHPLVSLVIAPHLKLWHRWWSNEHMTLSGLYGFTTPSWSLQANPPRGLGGYFSPSCLVKEQEPDRAPTSCQRPGFDFVPQFGARLSTDLGDLVWTVEADLAMGLMLSGDRPAPLDTFTPVEVVFAPTTNHFRVHLGGKVGYALTESFSVRADLDIYMVGQPDPEIALERDPLIMAAALSIDWGVTDHLTLTAGAIAWYADQRAFELVEDQDGYVTKESVSSLDVYPTFDVIWHY